MICIFARMAFIAIGDNVVMTVPSNTTLPLVGSCKRRMQRPMVDDCSSWMDHGSLVSPAFMVKLTFRVACSNLGLLKRLPPM